MKLKIKNLFVQACFVAGGVMALTSCNDFLDREPLSSVTPEVYFQTVDHFAAYSIARYQNYFPSHGGYGAGIANNDGGTDNMVAGGRSSRYVKGLWKVSAISVIATTSLRMLCLNMKRVRLPEQMPIFVIILAKCI